MKEKKGFTLVELLVVVAIIALLMGILLPSLARVRVIANRMKCGSNLADIGKSILMYAEENRQSYPIAGIHGSYWTSSGHLEGTEDPESNGSWDASTRDKAFGDNGKAATITSCLYLLIKYGNMTTKQFVCPDDADAKEFQLAGTHTTIKELADAWDFGDDPGSSCSYSYNLPFSSGNQGDTKAYPLDASSSPGSPLCGDRNPYLDKNAHTYLIDPRILNPELTVSDGEYHDDKCKGNTASHGRKAQNVLFNDGHVAAESFPNSGINNDNIWKFWPNTDPTDPEREVGDRDDIFRYTPTQGLAAPKSKDDSCLVNEKNDNRE